MLISKTSIREGDDSAAVGERQPDPRIGERSYELVTIGAIHELAIRTIHMLVNQRDPRVGERQRDPRVGERQRDPRVDP